MSEVERIKKAREELKKTLKALVESDVNLVGSLIVDASPGMSAGMPLSSYIKDKKTIQEIVGPSKGDEEIVGGTMIDARDKIKRLSEEDRLNLGEMERTMIEGQNGLSILIPLPKAEAILLIWGGNKTNVGFVYTVLRSLSEKIDQLTMKAAYK